MRVLFLCNPYHVAKKLVSWLDRPELKGAGYEFIRCYTDPMAPPPDIAFDLCQDTIHDISARCPGGPPDLMLVWEPGWQALPQGIEEAPFPVVALLSDWNLTIRPQVGMLGTYDYIFTDRPGVSVIQRLGYDRVEYWPMWGHDPSRFRVIPGLEQTWDITMVGNLNQEIQRERARWLYRLAKLSDRRRLRIAGGVYGEDYIRLLNQSKITFNRAIRKEFNMRCYEAAACGSLLFYDEENEEVRDYFEDRVHCVLYNENNLEELLEYYLTQDAEREQIVANALERVQEISQPKALLRLLSRIKESGLLNRDHPPRPYASLPLVERRKHHARQVLKTVTTGNTLLAANLLGEALRQRPNDPSLLNDYAVVTAHLVEVQQGDFVAGQQTRQVAFEMGKRAVQANPDSALAHFNLGQIYRHFHRLEEAQPCYLKALSILEAGDSGARDLLELHFPFAHNQFRTQYEYLYAAFADDEVKLRAARQALLIYQAGTALGELAEVAKDWKLAGWAYQAAALARPDLGAARAALARCLVAFGQIDDALEQLQIAFAADPFLTKEWMIYADLLIERGYEAKARAFLEEHLTVIKGIPELSYLEQPLLSQFARLSDPESTELAAAAEASLSV
jgi:tetratricopeptide (TPR) repeat protein